MKNLPSFFTTRAAFFLLLFSVLFASCRSQAGDDAGAEVTTGAPAEFITEVEIMVAEPAPFTLELVSNGKLHALRKSRVYYPFGEELEQVYVQSGQQVRQGQGLAQLQRENLERRHEQARLRFARASIDMEFLLLGRGYTLKDSLKAPEEVWRTASINSGYAEALHELRSLEADLDKALIRAPFAGVVGGISARVFEKVNAGEVFCTLIDNSAFLVEFPVMENELPLLSVGAGIEVEPFGQPGQRYAGRVTGINPMVDEHGRVEVTARVGGATGLIDGMNVRVRVQREVPGQIVVPRQAVLYRDNLEVMFKFVNGSAEWTYVNILHQNSTHLSVVANPNRVASLHAGDTVIVSGNMNLAHGSKVQIR